jgi:allophanate hydrolase
MVRVATGGVSIPVEVWRMPEEHLGSFMHGIRAPLGIGRVRLQGGAEVCGFLCEALAIAGAHDISQIGGWRAWLASRAGTPR